MELAPGSDPSLGLVVATGDLRQEAQKDSLLYAHIRNLEVLKSLASSLLNDSNIKNSNNEAESCTNNSRSGLTWLHDSRNKAVSLHQAECKKNEELQKKLKFMEATGGKQANVIAEIRKIYYEHNLDNLKIQKYTADRGVYRAKPHGVVSTVNV